MAERMSGTFYPEGSIPQESQSGDQFNVEGQTKTTASPCYVHLRTNTSSESTRTGNNDGDENPTNNGYTYEGSYTETPELICNICYKMMLLPTILPCGHSFCRLCLADWYSSSKKMACPIDERKLTYLPEVNSIFSYVEKTLYPEALNRREKEFNRCCAKRISDFEREVATRFLREPPVTRNNLERAYKPLRFLFMGGLMIASIILSSWTREQHLVEKVLTWNMGDVETWMREQGPWTKPYLAFVYQNRIDGYTLISDEKETLIWKFGIEDTLTEEMMWRASLLLRSDRNEPKEPKDFWSYKARWPEKLLRYGFLMDYSPRLPLLFMYLLDYDDGFLPVYNALFHSEKDSFELSKVQQDPTSGELLWMFIVGLIFPYYILIYCAYFWWSSTFVFLHVITWCFHWVVGDVVYVLDTRPRFLITRLLGPVVTAIEICIPWRWMPEILMEGAVAYMIYPVPVIMKWICYCLIIYCFVKTRDTEDLINSIRDIY